jgi:hypothetical protein
LLHSARESEWQPHAFWQKLCIFCSRFVASGSAANKSSLDGDRGCRISAGVETSR